MATFAKYVAPQVQRTDWGAITRGLSAGLQEVYKDREEQKAELDKLELDAAAKVNETEMGKSKTFNEFVLEGINTTKGYMASQNKLLKQGLITPAQYKMNILRAQEGWSTFAKNAETFNQDYADFLDRYDGDEASAMEAFAREQYFSLTDIKNKQIYMNPADGNMYIASVDPKTYQIDTANLMDVKTINNALNQKITKLKLYDVAQEYVKKFGNFAGIDPVTGQYVVSGVNEKDRENVIGRAASAILANDKAIASVLLDNMKGADGEPQFNAVSREQYESLSDEEKKRSIVMEANAEGVFVPVLTEQNKKDARDFTESVIGDMIQRKEKDPFEEKYKWASLNAGSGGGSDKVVYDFRPEIEAIYADPLTNSGYLRGANTKFGTIEGVNVINTDTGPAVSLRFYKGQDQFGMPQYATYSFQGNDFKSIIYDALVARRAGGGRVIPFQQLYPPSGGGSVVPQTTTGRYNANPNPPASNAPVRGDAMFGAKPSASPVGGALEFDNY